MPTSRSAHGNRTGNAQATQKTHAQNQCHMPAFEQGMNARRTLGHHGKARDQGCAPPTAKQESQLITQGNAQRRRADRQRSTGQSPMGGKSGREKDGFAFEQGAGAYCQVAVTGDESVNHPASSVKSQSPPGEERAVPLAESANASDDENGQLVCGVCRGA